MKKIFSILIVSPLLFSNFDSSAQSWVNGGNNLTATGRLGTTSNQPVAFITNNTERGRVNTAGNWGFGTASPTERVHINGASGLNALRVQINGSTKLLVHSSGGVAIGSPSAPPSNGLYVSGSVGVGTTSPSAKLHVVGSTTSGTGTYTTGYNYGLQASSTYTYGYGVYGSSDYLGVYGSGGSGSYGTYGYSGYIGAYGSGGTYGTYGYSYSGTAGAYGYSSSGSGVYGSSYSGNGVYGYSSSSYGGNFESYDSWGLRASTTNGYYAAVFYGHVYASDGYITSDKNLKKDMRDIGNAMSIINKLKPQNYEFKNDAKYASLHLPKGRHYGLLAQDLEQVLPNLISEAPHELRTVKPALPAVKPTEDGKPVPVTAVSPQKETVESISIKAVNYVELIPIMIKAMQEQQAVIDQQNTKIEDLTKLINKRSINNQAETSVKLSGASLGQSSPNPNSTSAKISYNLPNNAGRAELVITNAAGQKVKLLQLNNSGLININTASLNAGTYFYTLVVNGTSVDTKKMIVSRF